MQDNLRYSLQSHHAMPTIVPISAFQDNYIWLIVENGCAIVVDPGDATPVLAYLSQHDWDLSAILITHWHNDHTGGINDLRKAYPDVAVYGPEHAKIAATQRVTDKQHITLCGMDFEIMHVPGHTLEHVAYYAKQQQALFCGDTLFAGGCGRLFEGTAAQMLASLEHLAALPDNTQIYCAHEYTLSNLRFAQLIEPNNAALQQRVAQCTALREQQLPSLPSVLADEKKTNPFLRIKEPDVIQRVLTHGATSTHAVDVFAFLREWKNNV